MFERVYTYMTYAHVRYTHTIQPCILTGLLLLSKYFSKKEVVGETTFGKWPFEQLPPLLWLLFS